MEVLLFDNKVAGAGAKIWFISRYTFKTFKTEFYAFYPLIGLMYIILEIVPSMLFRESLIHFSPSRILKEMEEVLN